jgi:hypothetical protein
MSKNNLKMVPNFFILYFKCLSIREFQINLFVPFLSKSVVTPLVKVTQPSHEHQNTGSKRRCFATTNGPILKG